MVASVQICPERVPQVRRMRIARAWLAPIVCWAVAWAACGVSSVRADPLLAAAGDIACPPRSAITPTSCDQASTAELIRHLRPTAVAVLGDDQYSSGTFAEFVGPGAFATTWGLFKSSIHPVAGNHEYESTSSANGYFRYFGASAGPPGLGYYSYDLGGWHLIALNSNCSDSGCGNYMSGKVTTAEVRWLHADLVAHPGQCILAYWHHPRFSSGDHGDEPGVAPLWDELYAARADVVLNGHDHDYERFAPQDPQGKSTPQGIREFVVGTGGRDHYTFSKAIDPNSQFRDQTDYGVLFLTLDPDGYSWRFRNVQGVVVDSGSNGCNHGLTSVTTTASTSTGTILAIAIAGVLALTASLWIFTRRRIRRPRAR